MRPDPAPTASPIASPVDNAALMEDSLAAKATKGRFEMFLLSLSGGAFIGLGFVFYTTALMGAGGSDWYGVTKVLGGVVFSVGLILVVITGADLFTSTTMTVLPLARGRISVATWAKHWATVYFGNLIGALILAGLIFAGHTHLQGHGAWGAAAVSTAEGKLHHGWFEAFSLGILCNLLVCLAVWMASAGRSLGDKVLAIVGPVALFVASGFEHSVANMFLIPVSILIADFGGPEFWDSAGVAAAGLTADSASVLTVGNFVLHNLIPVTLGNIVGGGLLVALYYGRIFLHGHKH